MTPVNSIAMQNGNNKLNKTRRKMLKTTGIALFSGNAFSAGVGAVTANDDKDSENTRSAQEAGIDQKLRQLLRDNEFEQAHSLADEHNVRNSLEHKERSSDREVEPDSTHPKSQAEIVCSLVHSDDDKWVATGWCKTKHDQDEDPAPSVTNQDEAYALTWDSDHWSSPDRTEDNVNVTAAEDFPDSNLDLPTTMEMYQPDGVAYTTNVYHDGYDLITNLQTELIRTDPHPDVGVRFDYEHTWAVTPGWLDVTISNSVFSVDLTGGDSWKLYASADP